jgi:salicylate hydroxylase
MTGTTMLKLTYVQDPEAGSVTLSDGRTISGDLIIAADGVHSVAVEAVLGHPNQATPTTRDNFAYRILIPTSDITSDPETAHFSEGDDGTMKILTGDGRRLAWYPCRK